MAINNLGIPVSLIVDVFKEADSKSMKNIQDRVIVVGPVLIDDYAAGFQCLPKLVGIISGGSPNEGHINQVPLLRSKSELVIAPAPACSPLRRHAGSIPECRQMSATGAFCVKLTVSAHLPVGVCSARNHGAGTLAPEASKIPSNREDAYFSRPSLLSLRIVDKTLTAPPQ